MVKKILQYVDWLLFTLLSLVVLYFSVAILLSFLGTNPEKLNCDPNHRIYVATNGVHLYIILPIEEVDNVLISKLNIKKEHNYLSFGWGDKEFYTNTPEWSDLTFGTAFTALFQKSPAALHVISYKQRRNSWNAVSLCNEQVEKLNNYIKFYFITDGAEFVTIEDVRGYSSDDHFYKAKGNYTLFKTSNVWVNEALKKTNVKTSIWSPFDFGVLHHLESGR